MSIMTPEALNAFFSQYFPELKHDGLASVVVETTGPMVATIRLVHHGRHLRPGGTVSGPAMFLLADVGLYATILAQIGPVGLAVTTNMNMNFMRKPLPGDLIATCRLMKLGKRLAVGEATLHAPGDGEILAHATGTYAIPPGNDPIPRYPYT